MKYIHLIAAVFMGASFALAAPTLAEDPIQRLAEPFDSVASEFLKTLNISVPGTDPEPNSLVKTRAPSKILCDIWEGGNADSYKTEPYQVDKNIATLRGRSDTPRTVDAGYCERAICSDYSGISWCTNDKNHAPYTVESWDALTDAAQAVMDYCSPGHNSAFDGAAIYDDVWLAAVSYCT